MNRKKADFNSRGISSHEILVFHTTQERNIDSIVQNNLDTNHTGKHRYGWGSYFSELPFFFSLHYGKCLMIFRVLPGREYFSNLEGEDWKDGCH